jgi:hypothetical protein
MQDHNRTIFMMKPTNKPKGADLRTEDAVINGLFSGVLAGLAMILVLALVGSLPNRKSQICWGFSTRPVTKIFIRVDSLTWPFPLFMGCFLACCGNCFS